MTEVLELIRVANVALSVIAAAAFFVRINDVWSTNKNSGRTLRLGIFALIVAVAYGSAEAFIQGAPLGARVPLVAVATLLILAGLWLSRNDAYQAAATPAYPELAAYGVEHHVANFDRAFADFEEKLADVRRQVAARLLSDYPNKGWLEAMAEALRNDLGSAGVQINAVTAAEQTTVAKAPGGDVSVIASYDSLCAMTVGIGGAVAVSDIAHDTFIEGHPAQGHLGSWASVPIVIEGCDAGSICALEDTARKWTDSDRAALQAVADRVTVAVESWSSPTDFAH